MTRRAQANLLANHAGTGERTDPRSPCVPVRLIAMDLDGTLLDSQSRLSDENARAIREAARRGIEIAIVTGRRFHSAQKLTENLGCETHLVVNNGAVIKTQAGETLERHLLPRETAARILEATAEFRSLAAIVFDRPRENQVILEELDLDDPLRGGYLRRSRELIATVQPLAACLRGPEDPIQVMFVGSCEQVRSIQRLLEAVPFAANFSTSLAEYEARQFSILDVLPAGVSKATALEEWARRLGIARAEVMAIGDNWNDRPMLEFAGHPVVMANSIPELQSRGWPVTLSNDQNGVAEAIWKYALAGE